MFDSVSCIRSCSVRYWTSGVIYFSPTSPARVSFAIEQTDFNEFSPLPPLLFRVSSSPLFFFLCYSKRLVYGDRIRDCMRYNGAKKTKTAFVFLGGKHELCADTFSSADRRCRRRGDFCAVVPSCCRRKRKWTRALRTLAETFRAVNRVTVQYRYRGRSTTRSR